MSNPLPFQDPDARLPACAQVGPDWRGLRATITVDEVSLPFGIINGQVEIAGEDDGGWHVLECSIPLDYDSAALRVVSPHALGRMERMIAEALAKYVTEDLATDALQRAMGE